MGRWGSILLPICLSAYLPLSVACHHPIPLKPYTAYVVNRQSATLAAVNLATFKVTGSLPLSPQPERVLPRPHARQLYVVSSTGKIDVATYPHLQLVATLAVGKSAKDLVFAPDGRTAYVLNPVENELDFIDCQGGAGSPPEGATPKVTLKLQLAGTLTDLALSPDGKTLLVSSQSPNQLTFISPQTRQVLGTVEVGRAPGPMAILPDGSKVFVADTGEEKISVVDMAARALLSHIEIGHRPTALLVKPDGGELFILAAASSTMVIADAFHDDVEQTFPLGRNPTASALKNDMSVLYIANAGDGSVLALDVPNREVLASTHVGMEPCALALTPDDQRLLVVADRAASSLAILHADPTANDRSVLITTVTVGASPVDVVIPDYLGTGR